MQHRQELASKRPFDIDTVMARVRAAVRPYPKAAMFELHDAGYASVFEQLVACIISIRTLDETTIPVAKRLFAAARTPAAIARLSPPELEALLVPCTFADAKARQILAIARRTNDEFDGVLPCSFEVLTSFHGVGPKCASLALGVACGEARIAVDVHVHRVTNRWGYVSTRSPEATMAALEARLPRRYWVEINRILVPFGKHVCTGTRPKCSTCPVLDMCRQVGVEARR
ncbi:Endonuclease III [Minicystis rosea]|nr:Endonuclease III [Minicystis rosea]